MKQVCAEGDNEFAESIAENSIIKESHNTKEHSTRPHVVKSKPGFQTQIVNDGDDLSMNRTVSEKNANPTPRVMEINEKPQIQKDRTPQNMTRNKDSGFCSFQTQIDPRFAQGLKSSSNQRQQEPAQIHQQHENMFEQIKRKMEQEDRLNNDFQQHMLGKSKQHPQ